jgi:hypothetical protein
MPYLNEADARLIFSQRFDYSVYAITGNAEYSVDTPVQHCFYQNFTRGFRHLGEE